MDCVSKKDIELINDFVAVGKIVIMCKNLGLVRLINKFNCFVIDVINIITWSLQAS